MANASGCDSEVGNSKWTWEENKQFEDGLVEFPEDCPNRWERIAAMLQTKSAPEVETHFAVLLDDVAAIEAGLIELPEYMWRRLGSGHRNPSKTLNQRRNRLWRRERQPDRGQQMSTGRILLPKLFDQCLIELMLFLLGLEKYGKGDWKSISRYMVLTRSPAQVASHAQKYYERQEKEEQNKKRRSIFDNSIAEGSSLTSKFCC
ncbi:UNVERIFIED_CONTAM: Transcription factor DIVARICATA [Sesamum calycinum]|uniref:Transcription factor DIVARICATA n=1 Tax=Sesamum calycinum TaxID=2727403 RepID=A0AAW2MAQ6_9LAMI